MYRILLPGLIIAACFGNLAFAETPIIEGANAVATANAGQSDLDRRELARLIAPIKSKADLDHHLATAIDSPLNTLSSSSKWAFIGSLVFTNRGLASFSARPLETELSATEIYRILSLFGVQDSTQLIDGAKLRTESDRAIINFCARNVCKDPNLDGYWCSSSHTCSRLTGSICITSSC